MKLKTSLLAVMAAAMNLFPVNADASDWKMHTTFDDGLLQIVDTPNFVYFTSRTQPYKPGSPYNGTEYQSLFRFDKESSEMENLSADNDLTFNVVTRLDYSPEKGCLVAVTENFDIDILHDNGSTSSVAAYRRASLAYDKTINSVFIDPVLDRVYLSTAFGIVAINDRKSEVAESRIYGAPVKSAVRLGDTFLILQENRLLSCPADRIPLSLADFTEAATLSNPVSLHYVGPELALLVDDGGKSVKTVTDNGGKTLVSPLVKGEVVNIVRNKEGATVATATEFIQVRPDWTCLSVERQGDDLSTAASSFDLREIWQGTGRKGVWSKTFSKDGDWTPTRECMAPNSPSPFRATEFVWHPQRGLLVSNHGYDPVFDAAADGGKLLLSAYKDGVWTNLAPVYTNPSAKEPLSNPNGLAVDPDNQDWVYFGSLMSGMERINMADGKDVMHLSRRNDPNKDLLGFVGIVEGQTGNKSPLPGVDKSWAASCPFAAPRFDAYGNLWTSYADYDDQAQVKLHLLCWTADDRKASTSAENVRPPKMVKVMGVTPGNRAIVVPLLFGQHKDWIAYSRRAWEGDIVIIDTNGTPDDGSDDKAYTMLQFTDQDGSTFDVNDIRFMWEDPSTGNLWVGHRFGVFSVDPATIVNGSPRANRIKVARNDGTNLADYLLNDVPVNGMAVDAAGHKWFATGGAGLVCTSSDGRTIQESLIAEESPIPDDEVYGVGYIPTTNSLMVSTRLGLAEYFISGGSDPSGTDDVKVYPNPVRPDYIGYINIEGIIDGAVVKIVDASGNLVKELGRADGGATRWDGTNLAHKRVTSGVYFILCSSPGSDSDWSNVGKVLVVR